MNNQDKIREAVTKHQKATCTFRQVRSELEQASQALNLASQDLAKVLHATMGERAVHGVVANRSRYHVKDGALIVESIEFEVL